MKSGILVKFSDRSTEKYPRLYRPVFFFCFFFIHCGDPLGNRPWLYEPRFYISFYYATAAKTLNSYGQSLKQFH